MVRDRFRSAVGGGDGVIFSPGWTLIAMAILFPVALKAIIALSSEPTPTADAKPRHAAEVTE